MPISGQVQQQIEQLLASSATDRARVRRLISQGRWREAEPDITRARAVAARRVSAVSPPGAEAIQLGASEFQPASFLTIGSRVRRAVAYVEVNHGRVVDAKGTIGRYVRLSSNGNTSDELNHYCEVAVYGTP